MLVRLSIFILVTIFLVTGCNFEGPEEKAVKNLLTAFVSAVDKGDEDIARAILLDRESFHVLNPDASARLDAESFSEEILAEIIQHYRNMVKYFEGRDVKFASFTLGDVWYQYKGRQAFKDTHVIVTADGVEVDFVVRGIVRIEDRWRIVDLSGNPEF